MTHSKGLVLSIAEQELLEFNGGILPQKAGYVRPKIVANRPPKQSVSLLLTAQTTEKPGACAVGPTIMEIIDPKSTSLDQVSSPKVAKNDDGVKSIGIIVAIYKEYGFMTVEGKTQGILFSQKVCGGLYAALRHGDEVDCYVMAGERGLWAHGVKRVQTKK